jgi:hypothetical protein
MNVPFVHATADRPCARRSKPHQADVLLMTWVRVAATLYALQLLLLPSRVVLLVQRALM